MKLIKKGFTIIRRDVKNLKVLQKTREVPAWHDGDEFINEDYMNRYCDEILKNKKIVED